MPLSDLIEAIQETTLSQLAWEAAVIAAVLSALIEITPIKVNPISNALEWFGRKINGPLIRKVDELSEQVDKNEIDRIRWEILDFANSCRNGRHHTKDEFTHIIDLNTKYHTILEKRKMTNGQIDLEYEYIVQIYKHCMEENNFL